MIVNRLKQGLELPRKMYLGHGQGLVEQLDQYFIHWESYMHLCLELWMLTEYCYKYKILKGHT
jgi:hypothetical protein